MKGVRTDKEETVKGLLILVETGFASIGQTLTFIQTSSGDLPLGRKLPRNLSN